MHFPSARKCVLLNRVRGISRHSERVRMRGWEIGRKEVGEENKRKKGEGMAVFRVQCENPEVSKWEEMYTEGLLCFM